MKLSKKITAIAEKHLVKTDWKNNPEMLKFMEGVSVHSLQLELERMSIETDFSLAKKEYHAVTTKLTAEKKLREQSIEKMLSAISTLDDDPEHRLNLNKNNLLMVAEYLDFQVQRRKEIENQLLLSIDETRRASDAKSQFLSIMSHEIRSPLNVIIGMAHILQKEHHLKDQEENIDVLNIASNNLMLLINDILDYSKIESGKLELDNSPFDFHKLINNLKKAHTSSAAEKRNCLNLEMDKEIASCYHGDSVRIGQVLTNVLSNAIKFTKNGEINLSVSEIVGNHKESTIRISVQDTGIGISKENQKKIFEKFTQAESHITREFGGTGLGLTISRDLLGIMDSKLQIESTEGVGSTFYFDITLQKGNVQEVIPTQIHDSRDLSNARILIVDDLEYNLMILQKIVKDWKVQLDFASNGEEAVAMIEANNYDLVLMDLQMPVMDGRKATIEVRKFNQHVPIIALTASTDISLKIELMAIGMNDYLTKPFNPNELYHKLESTINQSLIVA